MMPAFNRNKGAVFFFVTYIAVALYFFMNLVRTLLQSLAMFDLWSCHTSVEISESDAVVSLVGLRVYQYYLL